MGAPTTPMQFETEHSKTAHSKTAHSKTAHSKTMRFEDIAKTDTLVAGGKGANLGEMTQAGFPVPGGFVIPAGAYLQAVESAAIRARLIDLTAAAPSLDPDDLANRSAEARELLSNVDFPENLRMAIASDYERLGHDVLVAVRSSATEEDTDETSFAGMNESFTNVSGLDMVCQRVLDCWVSLFGDRVVSYRASQELIDEPAIAVVVQRMVDSDRAGVVFTVDPSNRDQMIMEASFGFGESVVSGHVEPDTYRLDRDPLTLREIRIGTKSTAIIRADDGETRTDLAPDKAVSRALDDDEVIRVAMLARAIEQHYGSPQDIEFAIEDHQVFIVQSRPMTTLQDDEASDAAGTVLLNGLGVGRSSGSGPVRILNSPHDGHLLKAGEVLVAAMTSPEWLPTLRRAAALITDEGGATCHAAIVSRELGIPGVVGTRTATTDLTNGETVTVDAASGRVTSGASAITSVFPAASTTQRPEATPTAMKLLVNLAIADRAEQVAALAVDGVGLLRGEFMVTDALGGVHPRALIDAGDEDQFVQKMSASIGRIASAFFPRPVIYRTMDFRSNEFANLTGGADYEPIEENPMIGYRGAFRYIKDPDTFDLELAMLAKVRSQHRNVHIMIPFVRTRWELEACLNAIDRSALGTQDDMQRWIMAEVPSVIPRISDYAKLGIDGISIGSNDLTQLMLGVDRDSATCAELFDTGDEAVLWAIREIIARCNENGLMTSLCGQAPSDDPSFVEHLVRYGAGSVSVNEDSVDDVRHNIAIAEKRLLVEAARAGLGGDHSVRRYTNQ